MIDPTENIKILLEENAEYYDNVIKLRTFNGKIRNIFDGNMYKSFIKKLPENDKHNYVTTIFNTDGAPRFESSNYSIWPIYLQLNEIPIQTKLNRIITCGIWFGRNKPEMTAFLHPFTEMMTKLANQGITCRINNEERLIKVYSLICCVDSVARAPMQGVTLFNGKYGCNWCLHPGEWYEGSNRYPILQHTVQERNMKNMIKFMMKITDKECADVYGLKSISPLINLPYFDVCKGFVPDYMHCCLAGVGKQITNKFLESLPTSKIEELNKILLNVKVPHQLGRLSRSFADISDWKAKEWENFILYYSLPLFRYALPQRFVKYWSLFVESLYTLLKCDISLDELNKADEDLHKFVFLTQELFSKKAMTFNIHQLIHISESVLNWGPLWSHSTFPFESANKDILQAIHCAKGVNLQIVRYVHMQQTLHTLRHRIYPQASPLVINYCEQLTVKRIKKSCKVSSITYLGGGKFIDENIAQNFGMSAKCTLAYQRAIIDGCLVSSKQNNKRSDNSFAILTDNTFIRILDFLVDDENNKEITLCNIVNTSNRICNFLSMVRNIGNETIAIQTKQIVQICVFIEILEECYIATLPNIYHY
ncbi:uncharacterized protein [Temnothorax longispinosus]